MQETPHYLDKTFELLPAFAKASDLVALGIAGSRTTLLEDRASGRGIPYIELSSKRIRYPKQAVIDYLKANLHTPKQ